MKERKSIHWEDVKFSKILIVFLLCLLLWMATIGARLILREADEATKELTIPDQNEEVQKSSDQE